MTLRVSGKNLDVGESLRQHVLDKVQSMLAQYFDGSVSGHVVIAREGSGFRSDCTLQLSSGISLHAEGRGHEPYPCFEQAAAKIERRLRRYKGRLKGHSGPAGDVKGNVANYMVKRARSGRRACRRLQSCCRGGGDRAVEIAVRRLGGRRTRPDGGAGRGVRACRQRAGECCLSAGGWGDWLA